MLPAHPRTHPGPVRPDARHPAGDRLALVLLVAAEAGALVALVRLDRSPSFDLPIDVEAWRRADPVDALAAAVRWIAVIATAWLLLVTLMSIVACVLSAGRRRRGLRAPWDARVARVAPGAVRRIVEHAVVSGLAIGVVGLPSTAFAATRADPPVVTVVRDGRAGDLTALPAAEVVSPVAPEMAPEVTPAVTVATLPAPVPAPQPATVPALSALVAARAVVVAPGDHLWELAAREVARVRGNARGAGVDDDVARYWVVLCDANRDRLVSGDVNLVYAGETIVLPPLV